MVLSVTSTIYCTCTVLFSVVPGVRQEVPPGGVRSTNQVSGCMYNNYKSNIEDICNCPIVCDYVNKCYQDYESVNTLPSLPPNSN